MTTFAGSPGVPVALASPAPARQGQRQSGHQRHPGSEWIDANRATLPNNEWVAAGQAGLIGTAPSFDDLMAKVQAQNLPAADVAVAFITGEAL